MTNTPLPHLICPLCRQANGCAVAQAGAFDVACWCRQVRFDAALLARVPTAAGRTACVCARCAAGEPKPVAEGTG